MRREKHSDSELSMLVSNLSRYAYPELVDQPLRAKWSRLSSFAEIRWTNPREAISLVCDKTAQRWHQCALLGLLAHEMSHPCVSTSRRAEERTDLDAIERGLGVYLAAERITTGRYRDQVVGRGRDRYLGYQTVREYLTQHETKQLDRLLDLLKIVPSSYGVSLTETIHDTAIGGDCQAHVGGYVFQGVTILPGSSVKLLVREDSVALYIDEKLVAKTHIDSQD
ncbi:MAG: hypothetical protein C4K47_05190 [Candidatus Thorarchaeota archaeon]|nr:MAG: hypothetical protein C4K47_05190 [Candidatus Thorarchaeota archaeon]